MRRSTRSRSAWIAGILALLLAASTFVLAAPDRPETLTGTIARLDAARQTMVVKSGEDEKTIVWTADTRINGVLSPGARVTVRFAAKAGGENVAFQISVVK